MRILVLLVLSLCSEAKISTIVYVMLENQSYERFFGSRTDRGKMASLYNLDLNGTRRYAQQVTSMLPGCDPDHGIPGTTKKIFGSSGVLKDASMSGFFIEEQKRGHVSDGCGTMDYLNASESLPALGFLADQGVLFDRYFASVPGPTWPNRFFALTGTSNGITYTSEWLDNVDGKLLPQRSIFDQITDANLTWWNVFQTTPWEIALKSVLHNPSHMIHFDKFLDAAKLGTLPSFVWINPRSGVDGTTGKGSNDQHPDHDLSLGDLFLAEIYNAIRASPQWEETVFIVSYDEHGGYYDSVPTPLNVPPPDETSAKNPSFHFDRLGIRIPFIVVSPWAAGGVVESAPPKSQKPFSNSEYEHCSVLGTTRKLLGIEEGPLTKRDAWAATFEHIFSLKTPRNLPLTAPKSRPPLQQWEEATLPLNDLQKDMWQMHQRASGRNLKQPKRQGELHGALRKHWESAVQSVSDLDSKHSLIITAQMKSPPVLDMRWRVDAAHRRIMSNSLNASDGTHFCMTESENSLMVIPTLCRNASKSQTFVFNENGSIQSLLSSKCAVGSLVKGSDKNGTLFGIYNLMLGSCDESLMQSFGWYGQESQFFLGDVGAFIAIV